MEVEAQTAVDRLGKVRYISHIGIAGTDVVLPEQLDKPLKLNGEFRHGLTITPSDIYQAIIFWEPGHPIPALGCIVVIYRS